MRNILIFGITYFFIAIGGFPGFVLDRTGIAFLGALAMLVSGALMPADALSALHFPTIFLLFGLMMISAQFRLGGFYTFIAEKIAASPASPEKFLFILMMTSAGLSALLANDIVCLAFTPVIASALIRKNRNPVPYLLGIAISANIGSAATIIGNPQNMLIGQTGALSFGPFMLWCFPPVIVSLFASYWILCRIYHTGFSKPLSFEGFAHQEPFQPFNRWQCIKGIVVLTASVVLFFSPIPREITVMVAAGILLCSRTTKTAELMSLVDWQLIAFFCGLFIVIKGFSVTSIPEQIIALLSSHHISLAQPYILSGVSMFLSNLVSNVPAAMLLSPHIPAGDAKTWYVLALSSTFAGNLITIGSIANLITFQIAKKAGIEISFFEHAKAGVPVTLSSMAILCLWILIAG
jgi:Na+/H+ antiporter NhaD/arsenite permease-like protein